MTCHIPECDYPKGECYGACGSYRRHVKPYPETPQDTLTPTGHADLSPEEMRDEALQTMAAYGLTLIALVCIGLAVLSFLAWATA